MSADKDNSKRNRRDQQSSRDVRQEMVEQIRSGGATPLVRQPNRDRARGDWDRSGDHTGSDRPDLLTDVDDRASESPSDDDA